MADKFNPPAINDPRIATMANLDQARILLDLAGHPLLIDRLDGQRPVVSGIICAMRETDSRRIRELILTIRPEGAPENELLRILDFDNGVGYKSFGLTAHPTLPATKVHGLMRKLIRTFQAAIPILERRSGDMVNAAVDDFLDAEIRDRPTARHNSGPVPAASPQRPSGPAQIEDQRFRLTDQRADQISWL